MPVLSEVSPCNTTRWSESLSGVKTTPTQGSALLSGLVALDAWRIRYRIPPCTPCGRERDSKTIETNSLAISNMAELKPWNLYPLVGSAILTSSLGCLCGGVSVECTTCEARGVDALKTDHVLCVPGSYIPSMDSMCRWYIATHSCQHRQGARNCHTPRACAYWRSGSTALDETSQAKTVLVGEVDSVASLVRRAMRAGCEWHRQALPLLGRPRSRLPLSSPCRPSFAHPHELVTDWSRTTRSCCRRNYSPLQPNQSVCQSMQSNRSAFAYSSL